MSIMHHKILLKFDAKLVKQELMHLNPMLLPIIEKEIKKLWDEKIIVPLRFSNWVENILPVRKKNGEIMICVDFRNLTKFSLKDNYLLPKMDNILQSVVGSRRISMIDGYLGYILGKILRTHTYLKVYKFWRILPILKITTIKYLAILFSKYSNFQGFYVHYRIIW